MKSGLLGGVAGIALLIASGTIARAADIVAPEMTNWSGFYVGVHAGYGAVYTDGCYDCEDGSQLLDQSDLNLDGIIAGGQLGYNFQMDNIVFGVEGDITWMDMKDDKYDTNSTGSSNTAADVDLIGTVRGRLGVAMDDVLLYATGGVAIPNAESSLLNSGESLDVSFNEVGGVVGGGVEFAATDSLRLRAEGLYYYFGEKESVSEAHSGNSGEEFELQDAFAVRLGVNWYLN